MLGIYYSGTGNTKYCVEKFVTACDSSAISISIEDETVIERLQKEDEIAFGYSVQYSNIPKMVRDYVNDHAKIWKGKKIFVIATMGLFSGDGAGMLARLLKKHGAIISGGLHVKMPDSIGDEKALKRPLEQNQKILADANAKIKASAEYYKANDPTKEGLGILYHFAGLFGQRLYFYNKTKNYSNKCKVNKDACIGCGKCVELCPMQNMKLENEKAVALGKCTMCYRCVNNCPAKAITILGKKVIEQSRIEKYIEKE